MDTISKIGRLNPVKFLGFHISPGGQKDGLWECTCDCGNPNPVVIRQSRLRSKARPTRSCGCLRVEAIKKKHPSKTHGETYTRLYSIWHGMKDRCKNHRRDGKNRHYFGKGIKVCDEWSESYESFRDWALQNGYQDNLTLDRKDGSKDYCPENCRWADWVTQQNNKAACRYVTAWGETKTLAMWLKDQRCNIGRESLKTRLNCGWNTEEAISLPPTRAFKGNGTK